MPSVLILGFFHLGVVVRALTLWRATDSRVLLRYPAFLALTAFAGGRAFLVIALGGGTGRLHPYLEIWSATQPYMLFFEAAAAIEAFWIVAVHFRKIKVYGTVLLSLMVGVSVLVAWVVARWRGNWQSPLNTLVLAAQHIALGSLILVLLTLLWFRQALDFPIRANAIRHACVLVTLFATAFLGNFLVQVGRSQIQWNFAGNLILTVGATVAYSWWAWSMTRDGESLPFQPPRPMSKDQFEAADAADREANRRLRQAGSEILEKALRSSDI
ncbi:MAG TPA: hypothetical protein VKR43_23865 [Bryobacteraceae bacterium]|nr:hypothetical protein [Bryobacteraceae bacterium]